MPVIKIKKRKDGSNEEAPRPRKLRIKTKVKEEDEIQPEVKKSLRKSTSSGRSKKSDKGGGMKLKLSLRKSAQPEKPPKAPRLRVKPIRVPGEGYDSEASDIEDDPLIEEAIVLRVLPDIQAEFVKHSIDSGDYSGISIKWKGQRHAIVNINDVSYGAILVNLPTVIEVNKSVDRKNLLKTVDVSQMLLCIQVIESEEEVFLLRPPDAEDLISKHFEDYQDEINECKMKCFKGYNDGPLTELETKYLDQIATKPYDYKHGLTPPLYNVRNRRFRRKMGLDEFAYAEKCVEKLLRQDDQAEEVAYELVDEDEIQRRSTPAAALSQLDTYVAEPGDRDEKEEDDLDLDEAFQSDTEDAKDRVSFKDEAGDHTKENDLFDEAGDDVEQDNGEEEDEEEEEEEENEPDDDDEAEENAEGVQKQAVDEDRQHNELLKDELNELETTLNHARQKLQKAANPLLKSRFIESIKKLEREVELKKKQLKFSDETLQKPEEDSQPQSSEQQQKQTQDTANARETDDDDEEEEEDDEDEDEEDVEDDDEAEDRAASDQAQELDQNDLDMMMLFGAEGDDAEE